MAIYNRLFIFNFYFYGAALLLFSILLKYNWNTQFKNKHNLYSSYDYIVVGGGTAGCVIAARLSELDYVNVLLVEAGNEFGYLSKLPIAPTLLQKGPNDWSFETVPQKYSSFGLNNKIQFLPRGKGLGGSGQMNYFLHGLGDPADYDNWMTLNVNRWNYSELAPFFDLPFATYDKIINNTDKLKYESKIRLTKHDDMFNDLLKVFIRSSNQLKITSKMLVEPFLNTIYNGERESTYLRYIKPFLHRKNLHVLPNALVSKVLMLDNVARAIGINFPNNDNMHIYTKSEIILSCGAFKTPQLLMLSGIGPKLLLNKLNIEIIKESNGVGQNLHDHLNMPLYVEIKKPLSMTLEKIKSYKSIIDYFWHGKGYLSSPAVVAYGRGINHSAIILFAMGSTDEVLLRDVANYKRETFRALFPYFDDNTQEGFVFLNTCLQPKSRGSVTIDDKNPRNAPIIDTNYLEKSFDINCIIRAIRLAIDVLKTPAFRDIEATIHWPDIQQCKHLWSEKINDNYLNCIIKHGALTGHHAAGTCSMGGTMRVVDNDLRVIGVDNLRIVDASVLPTPISSPPNSVIISIAEKAAKIIKDNPRTINIINNNII